MLIAIWLGLSKIYQNLEHLLLDKIIFCFLLWRNQERYFGQHYILNLGVIENFVKAIDKNDKEYLYLK